MRIDVTTVQKIRLSELDRLDPIEVILEDFGPGRGSIIISCFSESWKAGWNAMGDETIGEFICSSDEFYLAGKLSNLSSTKPDVDATKDHAKREIAQQRRRQEISAKEAREKYEAADSLMDLSEHYKLAEMFGNEWWYSIKEVPNPDYQYLCRIIRTVQDGLRAQVPA